jgi:hypothetical protein
MDAKMESVCSRRGERRSEWAFPCEPCIGRTLDRMGSGGPPEADHTLAEGAAAWTARDVDTLLRGQRGPALAEPDLKVGTVDPNADTATAASWEGPRCRGVRAARQGREEAQREKAQAAAAERAAAPGRAQQRRSLAIHGLDAAVAWQVAAASVARSVSAAVARSLASRVPGVARRR